MLIISSRARIMHFLSLNSYEILLTALLCHLYGSLFFRDIYFYGTYVRIINTVFMYTAVTNSFFHREKQLPKKYTVVIALTFLLNLIFLPFSNETLFEGIRHLCVLVFLSIALLNIYKFILSPHRLDKALISASTVGYLLLIEIAVRTFMILHLIDSSQTLKGVDYSYHTKTFVDTTYYCTVTITSIGFGDIIPLTHNAKMATSLLGLAGQFYLVVIMGIMVSKFISNKPS